jgi:hypothetical protein
VNDAWLKAWSWHNLRIASGVQERLRRRFTTPAKRCWPRPCARAVRPRHTHDGGLPGCSPSALPCCWSRPSARCAKVAVSTANDSCRATPPSASPAATWCACIIRQQTAHRARTAERLPDPRPDRATFLAARAPIEARLNRLERLFGYPRWEWLVRQGRRAEPQKPLPLPTIAPGESIQAALRITPTRRGWLRLVPSSRPKPMCSA